MVHSLFLPLSPAHIQQPKPILKTLQSRRSTKRPQRSIKKKKRKKSDAQRGAQYIYALLAKQTKANSLLHVGIYGPLARSRINTSSRHISRRKSGSARKLSCALAIPTIPPRYTLSEIARTRVYIYMYTYASIAGRFSLHRTSGTCATCNPAACRSYASAGCYWRPGKYWPVPISRRARISPARMHIRVHLYIYIYIYIYICIYMYIRMQS